MTTCRAWGGPYGMAGTSGAAEGWRRRAKVAVRWRSNLQATLKCACIMVLISLASAAPAHAVKPCPSLCVASEDCTQCDADLQFARIVTTGTGVGSITLMAKECWPPPANVNNNWDYFIKVGNSPAAYLGNSCGIPINQPMQPIPFIVPTGTPTGTEVTIIKQNVQSVGVTVLQTGAKGRNWCIAENGCCEWQRMVACETSIVVRSNGAGNPNADQLFFKIDGPVGIARDSWDVNFIGCSDPALFPPGPYNQVPPTPNPDYCTPAIPPPTAIPTPTPTCAPLPDGEWCVHEAAVNWAGFQRCAWEAADDYYTTGVFPAEQLLGCRLTYLHWPTSCVGGRFVHDALTITDLLTGLVWEKKSTAPGSPRYAGDTYYWDSPLAHPASYYIDSLNSSSPPFANSPTWRLPTLPELLSTMSNTASDPNSAYLGLSGMDVTFSDVNLKYWTGTPSLRPVGAPPVCQLTAWYVSYGHGVGVNGRAGGAQAVRAVRFR